MSVEGLPNYGIMPIGPRDDIYDMENLESIGLYKGSTPLSLGTGSGNRGGTIALTYRRPADDYRGLTPFLLVLTGLCHGTEQSLEQFFRTSLGLTTGKPGVVMIIQTFGDYDKWNPHIHAIVAGGLFTPDDPAGQEALAQYIIRSPFSTAKMTYNEQPGTVIYRSKMTYGRNRKNFELVSAMEFIPS